jgi:hypothetical protein
LRYESSERGESESESESDDGNSSDLVATPTLSEEHESESETSVAANTSSVKKRCSEYDEGSEETACKRLEEDAVRTTR